MWRSRCRPPLSSSTGRLYVLGSWWAIGEVGDDRALVAADLHREGGRRGVGVVREHREVEDLVLVRRELGREAGDEVGVLECHDPPAIALAQVEHVDELALA